LLTCSGAERPTEADGDLALSDIQTYDAVVSRRYDDAGDDLCAKYAWAHAHDGNRVSKAKKDQYSEAGNQSSTETVIQGKDGNLRCDMSMRLPVGAEEECRV